MTSRTLFKNMYKTETKRNIWLFGICVVLIFICFPFVFLAKINSFPEYYGVTFRNAGVNALAQQINTLNMITYYNTVVSLAMGGLAVLNGIFLFSYLFSKPKQDFYFSQPIKRKDLFLCNYIQGILNVLAAYGINLIIVIIMAAVNKCCSVVLIKVLLQCFVANMLLYLGVYAATVLAVTLTGSLIFGILGTAVINFYMPAFIGLFLMAFEGCVSDFVGKLINLSPITAFISTHSDIYSELFKLRNDSQIQTMHFVPYSWKKMLLMLVIAIVLSILARIAYLKRQAENVGKAIVFPVIKYIVKGLLIIILSSGCAYILPEIFVSDSMVYQIVGFVLGVFLGLFILDAMLEQRWNACFKKGKKQLIYIAICTVFFAGMQMYSNSIRYKGFDDVLEYATDSEYAAEGYIVMDSGYITANMDRLLQFIEDAKNGIEGKVTFVETAGYDTYYTDLVFQDGKYDLYQSYNKYQQSVGYPHLLVLTGVDREEEEHTFYVLSMDDSLTFEDLRPYYYPTQYESENWEHSDNLPRYDVFYVQD